MQEGDMQFGKRFASLRRPFASVVGGVLAAVLVASSALADVAPPNMPPGSNIGVEGQTQVQMRAERITIGVQSHHATSTRYNLVGDHSEAQVDGVFYMRNLGDAEEHMRVQFPLADPSGRGSGFFSYPEVQNFVASVDGQVAPTTVEYLPNPQGGDEPAVRWAAFDVTFPVTREVVISVSYTITPTGYMPEAVFAYVLSTGAGWRGPIGKVDITMRLPYPATYENVVLEQGKTTRGARLVKGELRWSWTNLEPTSKSDIVATILSPNTWEAIVAARAAVRKLPRNAEKWLALSKAYIAAVPFKYEPMGGERFLQLGIQACERALALAPNSAEMHIEMAQLLWRIYYWDVTQKPESPMAKRILKEIDIALKLDPNDAAAKALKDEVERELHIGQG
jgi:hypothetical protein